MAFLPGRLQPTDAAPDDGLAASIVPVNSAEHFATFAANDNLRKAVVAAVGALFAIMESVMVKGWFTRKEKQYVYHNVVLCMWMVALTYGIREDSMALQKRIKTRSSVIYRLLLITNDQCDL